MINNLLNRIYTINNLCLSKTNNFQKMIFYLIQSPKNIQNKKIKKNLY